MKSIKALMLVLTVGAAFALGVWTGPYVTDSIHAERAEATSPVVQVEQPAAAAEASRPAPRLTRRVVQTSANPAANPFEPLMTAAAPPVQQHAKSLLNEGTNVEMAAHGFTDATLFVSTVYAARNTGIPFMLLKHRMLKEGYTLSEAIRLSKPELDAVEEMERARTKARAVVQKLGS